MELGDPKDRDGAAGNHDTGGPFARAGCSSAASQPGVGRRRDTMPPGLIDPGLDLLAKIRLRVSRDDPGAPQEPPQVAADSQRGDQAQDSEDTEGAAERGRSSDAAPSDGSVGDDAIASESRSALD